MYNSDTHSRAELPSSRQLVRSTFLAAVTALVLLTAVVLPAEYGIDPTGIGRVLRLTDMGNTKQKLAAEAAADAANSAPPAQPQAKATVPTPAAAAEAPKVPTLAPATPAASASQTSWRDEMPVTLMPGEGTEIKLKMAQGAKVKYAWVVKDGQVNFDTHGDAAGKSISYEKGRAVSSDEGVLEAAFTGNHGWYWRNRGKSDVILTLRTSGDYTDIKRVK